MRDEDDEESAAPSADSDRVLIRPYVRRSPAEPTYQLPESGPPDDDRPPVPDHGAADPDAAGTGTAFAEPGPARTGAGEPESVSRNPGPGPDLTETGPGAPPPADPATDGPDESPTAPLPRVAGSATGFDPALDDRDRRQVLWLVGVGIAIALAAVAGLIALWPRGGGEPVATDAAPAIVPAPDDDAPAASAPATSTTAPQSTASRTGAASDRAAPTTAGPQTGGAATATRPAGPPPTTPPEPTLAAPPAADRVGPVTAAGGRCLDVAGGIVFPGSSLAVSTCNGTLSQRWTLATDGTLRVSGSCATADGDAVEVRACGGAATGQWRAGPNGTLVGVDSGRCLTDSANGAQNGARVRLAACGAVGQRWNLP